MNGLLLPGARCFLLDTHVNTTRRPSNWRKSPPWPPEMMRFGIKPRAACCRLQLWLVQPPQRHQDAALELLREQSPWLEVDGEMRSDIALDGCPLC
jgi:malate dehydrogenase (oxaloacetate-decarboxylating)(NADP+)